GAGGILLSPTDMAGWTKALVSLMTDASLRREIGGRGRKQARRFSWERTARETIRVYERVHRAYHTTKH
ncbi:MAG: glycosyltransferase family 1 protein, partial [Patescibacteria group bacterium]